MPLLAIALFAAFTHAQTVRATLGSERAVVAVPVALSVTIENARSTGRPTPPAIDGATLDYARESTFSFNGRGRTTHEYQLTPQREGVIRIPPFTIQVDGRALSTEPLLLRVGPAEISSTTRVELSVDNDSPFVGEPFLIRFRWVFPTRAVQARRIGPVEVPDAVRILEGVDPRPAGAPRVNQRFGEIETLFPVPVIISLDEITRSRERFGVIEARVYAIATRPGVIELGPATVVFDETLGRDRSAIRARTEVRQGRSETLTIEARPLPTEGAPPGFDGLIGAVALDAGVDRTEIGVGDPITLRLRVRGDEPLTRVTPPDLDRVDAFSDRFRVDTEGWSALGARRGERVFETVLRAVDDTVDAVPPIRVPYFDEELGAYRVAETEPIPLRVRTRRRVTAADAEVAPNAVGPAPLFERTPLARGAPGAPASPLTEAMLRDRSFELADALREPASIAVLTGGPACVALAGAVSAWRRRRDPERHRRHRALARATRRLGASLDDRAEAVRAFIADHAGASPASITAGDAARLLHDDESAATLDAVLLAHDRARFANQAGETPARRDVIRALRKAHRTLRAASEAVAP